MIYRYFLAIPAALASDIAVSYLTSYQTKKNKLKLVGDKLLKTTIPQNLASINFQN